MVSLLVFGTLFLAIGIGLLFLQKSAEKFKKTGIHVTAKIHDVRKNWHRGKNSLSAYALFYTENNEEIITELDFASTGMKIGQEIPIVYDKDNPNKIKANTLESTVFNYAMSLLFFAVGLTIVILAVTEIVK